MKKYPDKEYLTPLHRAVAKSIKNPLRIIIATLFVLAAICLSLVDFLCGCFVLPVAIILLVTVLIAGHKAKFQNGKFGLKGLIFSSSLGLIMSGALLGLKSLEMYGILKLPAILPNIAKGLQFPFNYLNKGFFNVELIIVSVALLFLSNLFYLGTLSKIFAKNLPKTVGFIVSIILSVLSVGSVVLDALARVLMVGFQYKSSDEILVYITFSIGLLFAICGLLQIISGFYSIVKTRK